MTSQERIFKINKVTFQVIQFFIKVSLTNFPQNLTSKSRVIHVRISISKQSQIIMSSVAKVKFIKTKAIFRSHTKGVSDKVLSNQDQKIKSYSCSKWEKAGKNQYQNGKNEKVGKNISGLLNRAIRGFQFGAKRFQIGAEITNRCERDFKSGQRLQIGAKQQPARDVLQKRYS